jgi:hypothetical protein
MKSFRLVSICSVERASHLEADFTGDELDGPPGVSVDLP